MKKSLKVEETISEVNKWSLDHSILRKNPPKEFGVITLRNVITFAMQLAFEKGKDFVFDFSPDNPYSNGDRFDYKKLYSFMSENDAFCELGPQERMFFLDTLKSIHKL